MPDTARVARAMTAPAPDTFAAARSMARPVVRGWMPRSHAYAAIMATSFRTCGDDIPAMFRDFRFRRHLLDQEINRLDVARQLAEYRIGRLVWRMADEARAQNAIFAAAHNINGDAGFPLTEEEVTDVVAHTQTDRRKYLHKQQQTAQGAAKGVRRHG
jgi:hypothetical protein